VALRSFRARIASLRALSTCSHLPPSVTPRRIPFQPHIDMYCRQWELLLFGARVIGHLRIPVLGSPRRVCLARTASSRNIHRTTGQASDRTSSDDACSQRRTSSKPVPRQSSSLQCAAQLRSGSLRLHLQRLLRHVHARHLLQRLKKLLRGAPALHQLPTLLGEAFYQHLIKHRATPG